MLAEQEELERIEQEKVRAEERRLLEETVRNCLIINATLFPSLINKSLRK